MIEEAGSPIAPGGLAVARSRVTPKQFRRTLGRFASGVTIVTTVCEEGVHGMTANGVTSVSLQPPLVLVSLKTECKMARLVPRIGRYGISVLAEEHEPLSWHFAGRSLGPIAPDFAWAGEPPLPFIAGALAEIGCVVADVHPAGDHSLFVGTVKHLSCRDGEPLIFYTGSHRALRVGLSEDPFFY